MWQLRVQLLGGPVLIWGCCSLPAYAGCELVRGQGGAQVAALGAPGLLPACQGLGFPACLAHPRMPQEAARMPVPGGQSEWRLLHLFGWVGVCSLWSLLFPCGT